MERISGLLGHPSLSSLRIQSLFDEYEARETPESKMTKDLDLFELCVQAVEYEACEFAAGRANAREHGELTSFRLGTIAAQNVRTLQEFFATTVGRIQHPIVKEWAHDLCVPSAHLPAIALT